MISTSFPVPRVFHLANDMYPVPYYKLIEILKKRFFPQMESSSKQNIYAEYLWKFACSLKLTVFTHLYILICTT